MSSLRFFAKILSCRAGISLKCSFGYPGTMSLKHHSCGTSPNSKYAYVPLTIPMHVQDGSFVCETTYTRRFTTNSNKIDPSQWDTNKLCSQTVAYYAAIKRLRELGVVMHTFSSSTLRTEASGSLSLRSVWSRL